MTALPACADVSWRGNSPSLWQRARSAPGLGSWALALVIALITAVPLVVVLAALFHPDRSLWHHLAEYVLPEVVVNTLWLAVGVGGGVTVIGVTLAWLVVNCDFPGRRFFHWALLLPLALPTYVTAFVWLGIFDVTSPLMLWLRHHLGLTEPVSIRSSAGVIGVMSLALYPYVYLTARAAFIGQGASLVEAAQSLGLNRYQALWRVTLPLARPGIVAGLMLALMETLADFGTVAVFNYNSFTTAIYKAWFSLFSLPAAAQLASLLLALVATLVAIEYAQRGQQRYADSARLSRAPLSIRLYGWQKMAATAWASLIFALAFLFPLLQLIAWTIKVAERDLDQRYLAFALHSLGLSAAGAALVLLLALLLGYCERQAPTKAMHLFCRFATLGYAVPGTVLAVGVVIPIAWVDNWLIDAAAVTKPLLGASLAAMLLAYCARFLAVGYGPVQSGLVRISTSLDEAAQSLGVVGLRRLRRVHWPILRPSILTALALIFVDIMKELPMTLMTRPFGWDTLAVRVFEMTSEGEWERAALPALAIVLVGFVPIGLLLRQHKWR